MDRRACRHSPPPIEGLQLAGEQANIGFLKENTKPPDFSKYIDLTSLPKHELRAGGGRIVFVGDIHGMDKPFKKLLKKLNYDANHDMLIHTGDIILKGPQSRKEIKIKRLSSERMDRVGTEPKGGKPWLKKMEKRAEALKKPTKEDYKQFKKAASAKGWSIPDGWKFGDQIYQLARVPISAELANSSPYSVAAYSRRPCWHLANQPRRKLDSPSQPLSHPPKSKHNKTEPALRHLQELALFTDIPQNTDPWTKMNMRTILKNGKVSRDKDGLPWSDLWHKVIKLCNGFDAQLTSISNSTFEFDKDDGWTEWVESEFKGLDIKKWSKGLDTGCVYNLRLTALVLGQPWKAGASVNTTVVVDEDMYQVDEELDGEIISFGKKGRGKVVQVRCSGGLDR
ncbi:Calcineurin-like phosphoesterase [Rhizoctonia solani]|uniref:Calcineurin-like phosphoesterase n=1 Tax=Rhizoctonia solani TaxID=456999 RepID=A0A8H7M033_9AGAM|nr:Calcineurin-like phosphoesterase [Rhizoctonia solani]